MEWVSAKICGIWGKEKDKSQKTKGKREKMKGKKCKWKVK